MESKLPEDGISWENAVLRSCLLEKADSDVLLAASRAAERLHFSGACDRVAVVRGLMVWLALVLQSAEPAARRC